MGSVYPRVVPLPGHVRAFTVIDHDGCYNVYVNSNLPREIQQEAFAHEMGHISSGDFDGHVDIGSAELQLHKK